MKEVIGVLTYYDGTGRADAFEDLQGNEWSTNPPGYFGKFTKNSGSTEERYTYTDEHGGKMTFHSDGRLNYIQDRNENRIQATWKEEDYDWQIDKLTDTTGRDFTFSYYDTGRLEKITDFNGREIQFSYDNNDDLEQITLPEEVEEGRTPEWKFTYSSGYGTASLNHNLLTVEYVDENSNDVTVVSNTYETTSGYRQDRIKQQSYGDQETFKIWYNSSTAVITNGLKHLNKYFKDDSYTNVPEKLREYTGEWTLDTATGDLT